MVFLVVVAPFDTSELSFKGRLLLLTPYGPLLFLAYLPAIALQNRLFRLLKSWNVLLEAGIILLTYVLSLLLCFAYYRSDWLRGEATFGQFIASIFLPTVLLISFILVCGRWFISRGQKIVERVRQPDAMALSTREMEVLREVARGASNASIATTLHISHATVKTHLLHIYDKLGVNDRAAAVAVGYERGLLTPGDAAR